MKRVISHHINRATGVCEKDNFGNFRIVVQLILIRPTWDKTSCTTQLHNHKSAKLVFFTPLVVKHRCPSDAGIMQLLADKLAVAERFLCGNNFVEMKLEQLQSWEEI